MVDTASLASQLATGLGQDGLLTTAAQRKAYSVAGLPAPLVALPRTVAEVAHVLRTANALDAAVTPWGAGTLQAIGRPPSRLDLVLSLERLNRVLLYEPDDLTCSVEAGVTLGDLTRRLAEHNQMLPLDPPLADKATIGGLIAANASGARRLAYGSLRDFLIGIQVVHADGTISKAGGMVVKNVSGYDLMKLYLGSLGTLAVIVSANFKLLPRPHTQATALATFADLAAAGAAVEALLSTQLVPTAIDVLDQAAATQLGQAAAGATLAVRCEGPSAAVDRSLRDVAASASQAVATGTSTLTGEASDTFWAGLADFSAVADLGANEAVLKISVVPTDVPAVLEDLAALAEAAGLDVARLAHAGVGVVVARVHPKVKRRALGAGLLELQTGLVERWRNAVVLGCAAKHQADVPIWGAEPSGLAFMKAIKQEYDPKTILNPGRFVGGL